MEGEDLSQNLKKILVVGATGKQGSAFVHHFCRLVKPHDNLKLKCLTRDPHSEKCFNLVGSDESGSMIECVHGDLNDLLHDKHRHHFSKMLSDCTGMFVVLKQGENEAAIGKKLIDLARDEGIQWFVYSSVSNSENAESVPYFASKKQIEEYLRTHQSSFDLWTIIRPTFFYQNLLRDKVLKKIKQDKTLAMPLPSNRKLQMVDKENIGELAVNAFLNPQDFHNKVIDLVGAEKTMSEYASCLGVQYREISLNDVSDEGMRKMYEWYQKEGFHGKIDYCRELLPSLTTFENWAKNNNLISSQESEKSREASLESSQQQVEAGSA